MFRKSFITLLFICSIFMFAQTADAGCAKPCPYSNCTRSYIAKTGAGPGAVLDAYNGDCIKNGDVAIVTTKSDDPTNPRQRDRYTADTDCTSPIDECTADGDNIIIPLTNPGNKRWMKTRPGTIKGDLNVEGDVDIVEPDNDNHSIACINTADPLLTCSETIITDTNTGNAGTVAAVHKNIISANKTLTTARGAKNQLNVKGQGSVTGNLYGGHNLVNFDGTTGAWDIDEMIVTTAVFGQLGTETGSTHNIDDLYMFGAIFTNAGASKFGGVDGAGSALWAMYYADDFLDFSGGTETIENMAGFFLRDLGNAWSGTIVNTFGAYLNVQGGTTAGNGIKSIITGTTGALTGFDNIINDSDSDGITIGSSTTVNYSATSGTASGSIVVDQKQFFHSGIGGTVTGAVVGKNTLHVNSGGATTITDGRSSQSGLWVNSGTTLTMTNYYGFDAITTSSGTVNADDYYNFYVGANGLGGTRTREYGLYISSLTGSSNYGIVLAEGDDGIFFDGTSGMKITGSAARVTVTDILKVTPRTSNPASCEVGDFMVDGDGTVGLCLCTVAGSPGTWTDVGGGSDCT